jgi:hypothetical protein
MTAAAVSKFKIADAVPADGEAPFEKVSKLCGMDLRDFQMIVRYAMTNFVFREPRPNFIAHTAASRVLRDNKLIRALAGMGVHEVFPAIMDELEVLEKHPGSQENTESVCNSNLIIAC